MSTQRKIQIPYDVFKSLVWVLESIDVSNYDEAFKEAFDGVLEALQDKQRALERREIYSHLLTANKTDNEENQFNARIEYLKNKNSF